MVAPLPGVVTPADLDDRTACALWLGNLLGRIFPVADVYPGHVANYRAWKAEYGR